MSEQFPRVQRRIPPPFARPSVNLGQEPGVRRDWRNVPVAAIRAGDLIPGIGLVTLVKTAFNVEAQMPYTVTIEGGEDKVHTFAGNDMVYAFTVISE